MKKMFSSLSIKIGIIIILIELVVLTFTGIYYLQRFGEEVNERFFDRSKMLGNLLAQGFIEYKVVKERDQMTELIGDNPINAMVISVTRKVFYSLNSEYEGKNTSEIQFLDSNWFSAENIQSFTLWKKWPGKSSSSV